MAPRRDTSFVFFLNPLHERTADSFHPQDPNQRPPLPLQDTIDYIKEVIKKQNLEKFYDLTKPETEKYIEEMAKRILSTPAKFNLYPEIATDLVYLALYDLCILIGTISSSRVLLVSHCTLGLSIL